MAACYHSKMYLRNCWYIAANSTELPSQKLFARTLLDEPVVLYRKSDGSPAALEDRCSHRFYPLSQGDLKGDTIVCGYHGLEFDGSGHCVRVPGQASVPRGADVKSYPVVDRWRFIWIWMGDPRLADESLIPDYWQHDHPEWTTIIGDPLFVKADYRLLTDNLLDPSHVAFLHKTTLGSDVAEIPHETEVMERGVRVTRWTLDRPPAPIFARLGGLKGNVDRWQIITFVPPCNNEVDLGSCVAGTGAKEGNRSQGVEFRSQNHATPSTASSFYYFWSHARNFKLNDQALSKVEHDQVIMALHEDIKAMEGVQAAAERFPDKTYIHIRADGAGLRARRLREELIQQEREPSLTAA
jgi:vanillate O-demethylase monooxygenase subunit